MNYKSSLLTRETNAPNAVVTFESWCSFAGVIMTRFHSSNDDSVYLEQLHLGLEEVLMSQLRKNYCDLVFRKHAEVIVTSVTMTQLSRLQI